MGIRNAAAISFAFVAAVAAFLAAAEAAPVVGAVIYARDSQFWALVELGMRDAARDEGVDLLVALNRRQLPTEAQAIDDLLTRQVDAVVMSPLDKDASATAASRAKQRGIPIVEYNTFFADRSIASHSVGVDNKELAASGGREMAKEIAGKFGGQASIGLMPLPAINPGSIVRKNGMLSALANVKYAIASEILGATPEEGASAAENMLNRDPNLQIIWASNAGTLAGAASFIDRAGAKVDLFGIDMSEDLAHMMLKPDSPIIAVADQQPYKLGYFAVKAAAEDLKGASGEKAPRDIEVPVKLYLKSDPAGLNDYLALIQSLHH
jgi:ribose transport system substrate-binding protein